MFMMGAILLVRDCVDKKSTLSKLHGRSLGKTN